MFGIRYLGVGNDICLEDLHRKQNIKDHIVLDVRVFFNHSRKFDNETLPLLGTFRRTRNIQAWAFPLQIHACMPEIFVCQSGDNAVRALRSTCVASFLFCAYKLQSLFHRIVKHAVELTL